MWLITDEKGTTFYRERLNRRSQRALIGGGYTIQKANLKVLLAPMKRLGNRAVSAARIKYCFSRTFSRPVRWL